MSPGNYTIQETDPEGYTSTTANSVAVSLATGGSATANFGDQGQGTVSGCVFLDGNGNGVQDTGEPGLSDVTVTLLNNSGAAVDITVTAGTGSYRFDNVSPGNYTVRETDPEGFTSTTSNSVGIILVSGGAASANFGDQEQGGISGRVFNDMDGNGIRDTGELGMEAVTVTLLDSSSHTLQSTATAGDGSYRFSDVSPGNYTVRETDPEGFTSTTSNSVGIILVSGGAASANFGDQEQGSISGRIFNDMNGNGLQNPGEAGIAGVLVALLGNQGVVKESMVTSGDGSYRFAGIIPGLYTVRETDPEGYSSTTSNTVAVSVAAAGSGSANFGDQEQGTLSGVVFNDLNGNGLQDSGEAGMGGIVVTLLDSKGSTVQAEVTSGNGTYCFSSVSPGPYKVEETDPEGYSSTTNNRVPIHMTAGSTGSANFGDQEQGTVWGKVYNDVDGNGLQDEGESGIGGVTVTLLHRSGTELENTTTLGDGGYRFTGIGSGGYKVRETDPSGYVSTTDNTVPVSVTPAGAATANFGDQEQGTVSGMVFADTNGNGRKDEIEKGIGGVNVSLLKSGSVVSVGTTAGDGSYRFTALSTGTFTVKETDPEGYGSTTANTVEVSVGAGSGTSANFGDIPYGTVSGVVFNDTNGDGEQNPGEKGVGGVTVNLWNAQDVLFGTVVTSGNGVYLFTNVPAGIYTVEQIYPTGYTGTTTNRVVIVVGAAIMGEGFVSAATRTTGAANFGVLQQESVSGIVFNDTNGNGKQETGENGVGGVVIHLVDDQGNFRILTAGDGTYCFYNVTPGNYEIQETYPNGYTGTTSRYVPINLTSESAATANFGILQGDAPDHVTLTGPPSVATGAVSGVFILSAKNSDGHTSNVTAVTVFTLSSDSEGAAVFYSDAEGSTAITRVTIPDGASSTQFYYKDTIPGIPTVMAVRTSGMELGSAEHQIAVNAGTASKVILTGPASVAAGSISDVFTLTSEDENGNTANVIQDTAFDLGSSSSGTAVFYSDAEGTTAITRVTIPDGGSSTRFYYKDTIPGTPTVTAVRTSGMELGSAEHQIAVNAGTASKVILTGPASVAAGSISDVFTLTSEDENGNTANVIQDTTFDLGSSSSGTAVFYSDAEGTTVITRVTIPDGDSSASFYYQDSRAGNPTISAQRVSGMELGSGNHQLEVIGGMPRVTTQAVTNIGPTTAMGNGTIMDLGSETPTQHGICWNTTGSPTLEDAHTKEGSITQTGPFCFLSDRLDGRRYLLCAGLCRQYPGHRLW